MPEYLETTVDKFIFRVATDRLYSSDGIWVLPDAIAGRVRLGLSDFLQQRSGDVAFVHLKPAGTRVAAGHEFGQLETIKTTLDLISPVTGGITEVNPDLDLNPETVNQDPFGKGWLVVIQAADWQADRARLLDAAGYASVMQAQVEQERQTS